MTPGWRRLADLPDAPRFGQSGPAHPRSAGFTLFEILVVTVIIGIIATFAVLSIGSRALDDRLDTEARRLQELLALASDEALLQGLDLGFVQTPDGYAFLQLKEGRWVPAEATPLRPRRIEEPFYLKLTVEGRAVTPLRIDPDDKEQRDALKPQVLLLSSGEATAFTLDLRARDFAPHYLLQGDALGRLKLERKDG